jgi:hypothetical protein
LFDEVVAGRKVEVERTSEVMGSSGGLVVAELTESPISSVASYNFFGKVSSGKPNDFVVSIHFCFKLADRGRFEWP